jgi:hypothetical protein
MILGLCADEQASARSSAAPDAAPGIDERRPTEGAGWAEACWAAAAAAAAATEAAIAVGSEASAFCASARVMLAAGRRGGMGERERRFEVEG